MDRILDWNIVREPFQRINLLSFFFKLFSSPPNQDLIDQIITILGSISNNSEINKLDIIIENIKSNKISLNDLKIEFTSLFISPDVLNVRPFASAYLDPLNGSARGDIITMGGQITKRLKTHFNIMGYDYEKYMFNLPDHLASLIGFLISLSNKEIELLTQGKNSANQINDIKNNQLEFLDSYVLPWLPLMFDKLVKNPVSDFYTEFVRILIDIFNEWKNILLKET